MNKADVVIIGAGIIGLSTGYWLTKAGAKVIILDKGRIAWEASSRATGYLSLRGEQPMEAPLAAEAEKLWLSLDNELGYPTEWTPSGRMWAACTEQDYSELAREYEQFSKTDIPFRLIDGKEAREIIPSLRPDIVGAIHTTRSGHANPQRASQAFAWAFMDQGGTIQEFSPVIEIVIDGDKVAGVVTPKGRISTNIVVNCAGPQAGLVAGLVGVDLPVAAARMQAMVTAPLPTMYNTALIANGISARQTLRGNIHFSGGPHEWVDVALDKESPKPNTPIVRNIARRLVELMPSIRNTQVLRSWAGIVDVTPDQICVIDRLASPEGFIVAVTSGHGFGLAPSVGKAVSDLALEGETSMPVASLGLARFARLDPNWKVRRCWEPGSYNT